MKNEAPRSKLRGASLKAFSAVLSGRIQSSCTLRRSAWRPIQRSIESPAHRLIRHTKTDFSYRALPIPGIHDRRYPKRPSIGQGIMHKIHTPPLRGARWRRSRASVEGDGLPLPHAPPQLHALQSIEPSYPLAAQRPALTPEQHPDAQIPKPRARMGEITNAEPETRLILGSTPSTPGCSTELCRPTGLQATGLEGVLKPTSQFSAAGGPQTVFRSSYDSLGLSSERSATSRFNRLFSCSTCRRRRSSLMPRCAYFFSHI